MSGLPERVCWYGRDEAPPGRIELRAGPLSAVFEDGDLRYIRAGDVELVRRVYVALRDVNWNTVRGERTNEHLEVGTDSFRIEYDSRHRQRGIDFEWHCAIAGASDGTITIEMAGRALAAFRFWRAGFCVLHPTTDCAGRPYRAETPAGTIAGRLPGLIEPQAVVDGVEQPLFPACSRLDLEHASGFDVSCSFEGDLFEMEDQRNWTDASFKTYCTPLVTGVQEASPGMPFHQRVTIRARRAGPEVTAPLTVAAPGLTTPTLVIGRPLGRPMPALGVAVASHGEEMSARETELIGALGLDHLRVELRLYEAGWEAHLDRAARQGRAMGAPLEIAAFVTDRADAELRALGTRLDGIRVARVLVLHEPRAAWETTEGRWVRLARAILGPVLPGAAFGAGTNGNFGELLRMPPDLDAIDFAAYTINPQVHAVDEATLVENLAAQADTVVTARSFCRDRDVVVSRVTMKPPFNQAATEPEPPPAPGTLPSSVDPRQMSLFAAAWTVGSLRNLAEAGAASITYYETTGWAGLMETLQGTSAPDRFHSTPGMVFPVYHVFADIADRRHGELVACRPSDALAVEGLCLRGPSSLSALVANLGSDRAAIAVEGLPRGEASIRHVTCDEADARLDPASVRRRDEPLDVSGGRAVVTLGPYGVARILVTDPQPNPH
jgi:D-apionolactonase